MANSQPTIAANSNCKASDFKEGQTVWVENPFSKLGEFEARRVRRASSAITNRLDLPCDADSSYRTTFHSARTSLRPKWVPAVVTDISVMNNRVVVTTTKVREKRVTLKGAELDKLMQRDEDVTSASKSIENMAYLKYPNMAEVLNNLQSRYELGQPFTLAEDILVCFNPLNMKKLHPQNTGPWADLSRRLPYGTRVQHINVFHPVVQSAYGRDNISDLPTHLYTACHKAWKALSYKMKPQTIVMHGTADSGKSFCARLILDYLVTLSSNRRDSPSDVVRNEYSVRGLSPVCTRLLLSNVILEAFTDAAINGNDVQGSLRSYCGRMHKIFYEGNTIAAAQVSPLLFCRSRLLYFGAAECSFEIFYMLLAGTTPTEQQALGLRAMSEYALLSNRGSICRARNVADDSERFMRLRKCLQSFKIGNSLQTEIFAVLSGILELANTTFYEGKDGVVVVRDPAVVQTAARLLGVSARDLEDVLVMKFTRRNMYENVTFEEAVNKKGTILQTVYAQLMSYVVRRMNAELMRAERPHAVNKTAYLGILDMYGLDQSSEPEANGLDLLCRNFVAERMHLQLVEHLFKNEEATCKKEGITLQDSQYANNDAVLKLLDQPQIGLFALLDDASKYPRETDSGFLKRCVSMLTDVEHFIYPAKTATRLRSTVQQQFLNSAQRSSARTRFQVVHYNQQVVTYNALDFLRSNKHYNDVLCADTQRLLRHSSNSVLSDSQPETPTGGTMFARGQTKKQQTEYQLRGTMVKGLKVGLHHLANALSFTDLHFIQCFAPNAEQHHTNKFCPHWVSSQMQSCGVLDGVRHLRVGFKWRSTYKSFIMRFLPIVKGNDYLKWPPAPGVTLKDLSEELVRVLLMMLRKDYADFKADIQFGETMVFLRYHIIDSLERLRDKQLEYRHNATKAIQRCWRRYAGRKRAAEMRLGFQRLQASLMRNYMRDRYRLKLRAVETICNAAKNSFAKQDFVRKRQAAIVVQSFLRRRKHRFKWLRLRRTMRRVQTLSRGFLIRQQILRSVHAAHTIQCAVRRYLARLATYNKKLECVLSVQARYRAAVWRRDNTEALRWMIERKQIRDRSRAANQICNYFKNWLCAKRMQKLRASAIVLQRFVRVMLRERKFPRLTAAAIKITRVLRGHMARVRVHAMRANSLVRRELMQLRVIRSLDLRSISLFDVKASAAVSDPTGSPNRTKKNKSAPGTLHSRIIDVDVLRDTRQIYPDGWAAAATAADSILTQSGSRTVSYACGGSHTLALTSAGDVYAWGWNDFGQLGVYGQARAELGLQFVRFPVPGQRVVITSIASGEEHSVAVSSHGDVYTWGSNARGQLGLGNLREGQRFVGHPMRVDMGGRRTSQVACGSVHTVALIDTGSVFTWGAGAQLGIGPIVGHGDRNVPCCLKSLMRNRVRVVACGSLFSVAVTHKHGDVFTWGTGSRGQLGHGDTKDRFMPRRIEVLAGSNRLVCIADVQCGQMHACAVSTMGRTYTWGSGKFGQLGLGRDTVRALKPTLVPKLRNYRVIDIGCGARHTLVLTNENTAFAFGPVSCVKPNQRDKRAGVEDPALVAAASFVPRPVILDANRVLKRIVASHSYSVTVLALEFSLLPPSALKAGHLGKKRFELGRSDSGGASRLQLLRKLVDLFGGALRMTRSRNRPWAKVQVVSPSKFRQVLKEQGSASPGRRGRSRRGGRGRGGGRRGSPKRDQPCSRLLRELGLRPLVQQGASISCLVPLCPLSRMGANHLRDMILQLDDSRLVLCGFRGDEDSNLHRTPRHGNRLQLVNDGSRVLYKPPPPLKHVYAKESRLRTALLATDRASEVHVPPPMRHVGEKGMFYKRTTYNPIRRRPTVLDMHHAQHVAIASKDALPKWTPKSTKNSKSVKSGVKVPSTPPRRDPVDVASLFAPNLLVSAEAMSPERPESFYAAQEPPPPSVEPEVVEDAPADSGVSKRPDTADMLELRAMFPLGLTVAEMKQRSSPTKPTGAASKGNSRSSAPFSEEHKRAPAPSRHLFENLTPGGRRGTFAGKGMLNAEEMAQVIAAADAAAVGLAGTDPVTDSKLPDTLGPTDRHTDDYLALASQLEELEAQLAMGRRAQEQLLGRSRHVS